MSTKRVPFPGETIRALIQEHPTPFYVYDERAIRENAKSFCKAFSWVPGGFKNYFAVKALPNPRILKLLKEEGMGADCSSLPELLLAQQAGLKGEEIILTSNDTPAEEYIKAREMGAVINLDDISHIPFLERHAGIPDLICFRYNPGPLKGGNAIIGEPEEAKYGFTREHLIQGYREMKEKGVKRFGLHTMVASNELDPLYFVDTAQILFDLIVEINRVLGTRFEFVNLGGGFGIPYRQDQEDLDVRFISEGIHKAYRETIERNGLHPIRIVTESGRMITGPYGYLVTRVRHVKRTYKTFVGMDASMADLMRPAIYGAYHHITVLGKEEEPLACTCDVTGSLCENNDKFAIDRKLPEVETGDILVIHDTGAHGHAMGFNYNGKLRSAEFLMRQNGSFEMIRRAETVDDLFATLSV